MKEFDIKRINLYGADGSVTNFSISAASIIMNKMDDGRKLPSDVLHDRSKKYALPRTTQVFRTAKPVRIRNVVRRDNSCSREEQRHCEKMCK